MSREFSEFKEFKEFNDVNERLNANIEWSHGHLGKRYYLSQGKAELVRLQMIEKGRGGEEKGLLQAYPCTWTDEFTWPKIEGNRHWHVGHRPKVSDGLT